MTFQKEWAQLGNDVDRGHFDFGLSALDMLTALEQWVERKQAPDQIPASHMSDGRVDRTRPLCPYPQTAKYKGTGSAADAASFTCQAP